jgi:carbon storage regulator
MLVLTRRIGESILIGENVEITLVRVDGDQVRIGVTAPHEVLVQRKELAEQIRLENLRAAETARQADPSVLEALPKTIQQHGQPKIGRDQQKSHKEKDSS